MEPRSRSPRLMGRWVLPLIHIRGSEASALSFANCHVPLGRWVPSYDPRPHPDASGQVSNHEGGVASSRILSSSFCSTKNRKWPRRLRSYPSLALCGQGLSQHIGNLSMNMKKGDSLLLCIEAYLYITLFAATHAYTFSLRFLWGVTGKSSTHCFIGQPVSSAFR
jgi:hypothetical protein